MVLGLKKDLKGQLDMTQVGGGGPGATRGRVGEGGAFPKHVPLPCVHESQGSGLHGGRESWHDDLHHMAR